MPKCNHQRRYFNINCPKCGKHVIYLYEHMRNMHGDNGRKQKKTKTKKPIKKPSKKEKSDNQSIVVLEAKLEALTTIAHQLQILQEKYEDLWMEVFGKNPNETISKILGESYDPKHREKLFDELQRVLKERAQVQKD